MNYALVDSEGATLDFFNSAATARDFLRDELARGSDSDSPLEDFLILGYRDGVRSGSPIAAMDFLAADPRNFARVVRVWRGRGLVFAFDFDLTTEKITIPDQGSERIEFVAVGSDDERPRSAALRRSLLSRRTVTTFC
jgi:hypothetical protein